MAWLQDKRGQHVLGSGVQISKLAVHAISIGKVIWAANFEMGVTGIPQHVQMAFTVYG